jgi:3-hydroxy-3-methylglutaryl CoA synthase
MKDITKCKPESSPPYKPMTVKKKAPMIHRQQKAGERMMRQHQIALRAYELFFYMEEDDEEDEEESEEKPYYKEIIDGRVVYKYTKPEPKKY